MKLSARWSWLKSLIVVDINGISFLPELPPYEASTTEVRSMLSRASLSLNDSLKRLRKFDLIFCVFSFECLFFAHKYLITAEKSLFSWIARVYALPCALFTLFKIKRDEFYNNLAMFTPWSSHLGIKIYRAQKGLEVYISLSPQFAGHNSHKQIKTLNELNNPLSGVVTRINCLRKLLPHFFSEQL